MSNIPRPLTEAQIKAQIRKILFPRGIRCPRCQQRYSFKIEDQYYCKKCRYKFSFKQCCLFAGSKLSFSQLWQLLDCFLGELSFEDAEHVTKLSHMTVRRWYRRFNAIIPLQLQKLSGIVEIDEAFVGRQKFKNQTIVIGALERDNNQIVLKCIPDREQGTTDTFILETVDKASLVCTDAWPGYEHLPGFFGYGHEVVNHSAGSFGLTNRIENVWMCLRRFIKKSVSPCLGGTSAQCPQRVPSQKIPTASVC